MSQRKIDDVVAGRFPKIVQEVAALQDEDAEARLKDFWGDDYRTPEEREANAQAMQEASAAKRAAQVQAMTVERVATATTRGEPK